MNHQQTNTETPAAVLYTNWLTSKTGPRGGQQMQCQCGWSIYLSDKHWAFKCFEHLAQHGTVGVAPIPERKPAPKLRRIK